jgi:hypothetical protein
MGFVRGNLRGRGLRGYVPGGMALPVYKFNGLGCACKKRGMGADDLYTGLNPDGSVDTSWIPAGNLPNAVTSTNITSNPNQYYLPGLMNAPIYPGSSAPSAGTSIPILADIFGPMPSATQPSTSISGSTVLLGGLGILALVLIASRRR